MKVTAEQKKEISDKLKSALNSNNYYVIIATTEEVFEAQNNKSLMEISYILDFAHFKKLNEINEFIKKQNQFIVK